MNEYMRDQLDAAIDRVATQLVSVEPDGQMSDRLASRLPERSATWSWLVGQAPQFAAAAGVALLVFFVFSNRSAKIDEAMVIEVAAVPTPIVEFPPVVAPAVVAGTAVTTPQDDNTFDFDYGLPQVAGLQEIAVTGIDIPPAAIAPLVLTDLPLANDLLPQRY